MSGPIRPRVALYLDPSTSEVTEEHSTLHEGLSTFCRLSIGARLMCNGAVLASFSRAGWVLDQPGITRLTEEFNAAIGASK